MSVRMQLDNNDVVPLHVTRVQVADGSVWSADWSAQQLQENDIDTEVPVHGSFSVALSSRIGWKMTNLQAIVTVVDDFGHTKEISYTIQ